MGGGREEKRKVTKPNVFFLIWREKKKRLQRVGRTGIAMAVNELIPVLPL